MKYSFTSSTKILLLNLKIEYLLTPWNLKIDFQNGVLETKQRNWFLIGYKTNSVSLRFIRNVNIQENLFGANIFIKTMGQNLTIKYLKKDEAQKIKNLMLDFNQYSGKQIVIA